MQVKKSSFLYHIDCACNLCQFTETGNFSFWIQSHVCLNRRCCTTCIHQIFRIVFAHQMPILSHCTSATCAGSFHSPLQSILNEQIKYTDRKYCNRIFVCDFAKASKKKQFTICIQMFGGHVWSCFWNCRKYSRLIRNIPRSGFIVRNMYFELNFLGLLIIFGRFCVLCSQQIGIIVFVLKGKKRNICDLMWQFTAFVYDVMCVTYVWNLHKTHT